MTSGPQDAVWADRTAGTRPPLTIAHIDPEKGWGGGQQQLLDLSCALRERGHAQVVLCHPQGKLRPVLEAHAIPLVPVSIRNDADLLAAWRIRRILSTRTFDIVHFHTSRAHALAPFLARGTSRFIVTRHMDYAPHFRPRVRLLYNRAVDGVIAVSEAIAAILRVAGVAGNRIRVIRLGIDCAHFAGASGERAAVRREWGIDPDAVVLFTTAVLEARKGHADLLVALAALHGHTPSIHWVICGDGTQRPHLEESVRALGLQERVTFTGFAERVDRLLAGADIFVLPSRQEGLGLAAMEAMAAGLPVIASRVGGLVEVIVDGGTGLLVPPGDPAALRVAVARLAGDLPWRHRLGERGRERAFAHFDRAAVAAAFERYYYELRQV